MSRSSRRRLLRASGVVAVGSFAGCLADMRGEETETPAPNLTKLGNWEPSLACSTEERGGMVGENIVKVARVESGIAGSHDPIEFADLTFEERDVSRTATEEGGYGTCTHDASNAFDRFVGRVRDHSGRQEDTLVYLERSGWYYGLYVTVGDTGVSFPSR